jgi:hypothetical protein
MQPPTDTGSRIERLSYVIVSVALIVAVGASAVTTPFASPVVRWVSGAVSELLPAVLG